MELDIDILADCLGDHNTASSEMLLTDLPNSGLLSPSGAVNYAREMADTAEVLLSNMAEPNQAGDVITKLEDIFESLADCLLDEKKELTIRLKPRARRTANEDSRSSSQGRRAGERSITFPSKSPQEAWRFSESQYI